MLFYHITRPENVEAIECEGLRADPEGNIFAFSDLIVADAIARNQIFADPYVVFWIRSDGIIGEVCADDVAESCRRFQCIIRQEHIEPEHLCYLATMKVETETLTPWQRLWDAACGIPREESEDLWRSVRSLQAGADAADSNGC